MKVCIIGNGVLGDATGYALKYGGHEVVYHDPPKGIEGSPDGCDVALICVPTPMGTGGRCLRHCVNEAAEWLHGHDYRGYVGIRSTVPPGTCDAMQATYPDMRWFSWPEFLRDAHAREDALKPSRVVWGVEFGQYKSALLAVVSGLRPMTISERSQRTYICTTPTGAEFIKYATNAIHAVNVGLANELAALATAYGLDWNALLPPLTPGDPYLPDNIRVTKQGGYGGKCLPKDTAALLADARGRGIGLPILAATDAANRVRRPEEYTGINLPGEAN